MAENSNINWTTHTANLWWGCTKVHEGCDYCYAEALSKRFDGGNSLWGNYAYRREIKSVWKDLDRFQKKALELNENHRVFVGSMMDIFEKPMPLINSKGELQDYTTDKLRQRLFENIDNKIYPNLTFLLLTKRPSNIKKYIPNIWTITPPNNVMFGTSPVNQKTFDDLITQLSKVNGKKFLSIEPQLDYIKLHDFTFSVVSWIIEGGESGNKKRPFNVEWARKMRDECKRQEIPYFFKQIDKIQPIPEDLQIREFPDFYKNIK